MNKKLLVILINVIFMIGGCFGLLQDDSIVYIDPDTGVRSQSWFYFPSQTLDETKEKLIQRMLKSLLYKTCTEKGDIPRATYSEPKMSLTLTCWPKQE